jgi:hypothetical protein
MFQNRARQRPLIQTTPWPQLLKSRNVSAGFVTSNDPRQNVGPVAAEGGAVDVLLDGGRREDVCQIAPAYERRAQIEGALMGSDVGLGALQAAIDNRRRVHVSRTIDAESHDAPFELLETGRDPFIVGVGDKNC